MPCLLATLLAADADELCEAYAGLSESDSPTVAMLRLDGGILRWAMIPSVRRSAQRTRSLYRLGGTYAWGDSYDPIQGRRANSWQGSISVANEALDSHHGTAAVGCYEPNGYGLFDMVGNVWEYAGDYYLPDHFDEPTSDPQGAEAALSARHSPTGIPQVTIKGDSRLCAPNFCFLFRPAARQPQEPGLGSNQIGFRTVQLELAA